MKFEYTKTNTVNTEIWNACNKRLEQNLQELTSNNVPEAELKEYFDDPSTVPAKVIGVHDALSSQLTKEQCFSTQVFGYLVKLSSKHG